MENLSRLQTSLKSDALLVQSQHRRVAYKSGFILNVNTQFAFIFRTKSQVETTKLRSLVMETNFTATLQPVSMKITSKQRKVNTQKVPLL
jgi:hypothetical protein